ncbi:hypothetical protein Bbelb_054370 [Branchiostoma belcheri]|nr:hypothetical protein Bbelb_054370 [Branchiostoma belcheri]
MAILKRSCCCCGCDVKAGSIVVAVIWIILFLIGLGYNATSLTPIGRALLAVYAVSLGTHILLIIAVVKAIRPLLLTWVIVTIICTVAALAIYIYVTDVDVESINRIVCHVLFTFVMFTEEKHCICYVSFCSFFVANADL